MMHLIDDAIDGTPWLPMSFAQATVQYCRGMCWIVRYVSAIIHAML